MFGLRKKVDDLQLTIEVLSPVPPQRERNTDEFILRNLNEQMTKLSCLLDHLGLEYQPKSVEEKPARMVKKEKRKADGK